VNTQEKIRSPTVLDMITPKIGGVEVKPLTTRRKIFSVPKETIKKPLTAEVLRENQDNQNKTILNTDIRVELPLLSDIFDHIDVAVTDQVLFEDMCYIHDQMKIFASFKEATDNKIKPSEKTVEELYKDTVIEGIEILVKSYISNIQEVLTEKEHLEKQLEVTSQYARTTNRKSLLSVIESRLKSLTSDLKNLIVLYEKRFDCFNRKTLEGPLKDMLGTPS